jgi:hypothetical protein
MRFYPTAPGRRAVTVLADVSIAALLLLFAALAISAHDAAQALAGIARGVEDAGAGAQAALESAARQVGEVPLVGGELASALREAAAGTGADAVEVGRSGRRDIEVMADVLGWSLFLIPTLLLLIGYLPNRWAQIQRLNAAARVLGDGRAASDHAHLIAMRAVFGLPYPTLLRYTDDPFGDLERGSYDALVRAAYEEAGMRPPPPDAASPPR